MDYSRRIANIINQLYQSFDGMQVSLAERDRLHISDSNFTYGEINPDTFVEMLDVVKPQPGEVFCDLGAGAGKAVICAALCNDWKKCYGIEIFPGLVKLSNEALLAFEKLPEVKKMYPERHFNIQFLEGDVLKNDLPDADVFYIHVATTWGPYLWDTLKEKLNHHKLGIRVIVNTKQLDADYFEKIDEQQRLMGWGESMVFSYRKVR
jgi:precorrin-6B methylase 2